MADGEPVKAFFYPTKPLGFIASPIPKTSPKKPIGNYLYYRHKSIEVIYR
jgi:hypothetical protein